MSSPLRGSDRSPALKSRILILTAANLPGTQVDPAIHDIGAHYQRNSAAGLQKSERCPRLFELASGSRLRQYIRTKFEEARNDSNLSAKEKEAHETHWASLSAILNAVPWLHECIKQDELEFLDGQEQERNQMMQAAAAQNICLKSLIESLVLHRDVNPGDIGRVVADTVQNSDSVFIVVCMHGGETQRWYNWRQILEPHTSKIDGVAFMLCDGEQVTT
jgi:hypothetical protein